MPSRPQFSLRVLFFVMAMVCLASATVAELPEEQKFATTAQDVLRIVLCIALPAMFLAGAVAKRGYERTMYIGGLFAASIPLLRAFATLYGLIASETPQTLSEQLYGRYSPNYVRRAVSYHLSVDVQTQEVQVLRIGRFG